MKLKNKWSQPNNDELGDMFGLQGDTVYSHLGDKPGNQVGDSQLGDTTLNFAYLGDSVGNVIYISLPC